MPLLVRKINRAKWQQNDILNGEEVSADARMVKQLIQPSGIRKA